MRCMVISNSGRNASPIEVAMEAKAAGLDVVVLTSLDMSKSTSFAPCLRQKSSTSWATTCLDNGGVPGDAATRCARLRLQGRPHLDHERRTAAELALDGGHRAAHFGMGVTPPTYVSQNADGGAAHNEALATKYRHRIRRPI